MSVGDGVQASSSLSTEGLAANQQGDNPSHSVFPSELGLKPHLPNAPHLLCPRKPEVLWVVSGHQVKHDGPQWGSWLLTGSSSGCGLHSHAWGSQCKMVWTGHSNHHPAKRNWKEHLQRVPGKGKAASPVPGN